MTVVVCKREGCGSLPIVLSGSPLYPTPPHPTRTTTTNAGLTSLTTLPERGICSPSHYAGVSRGLRDDTRCLLVLERGVLSLSSPPKLLEVGNNSGLSRTLSFGLGADRWKSDSSMRPVQRALQVLLALFVFDFLLTGEVESLASAIQRGYMLGFFCL